MLLKLYDINVLFIVYQRNDQHNNEGNSEQPCMHVWCYSGYIPVNLHNDTYIYTYRCMHVWCYSGYIPVNLHNDTYFYTYRHNVHIITNIYII